MLRSLGHDVKTPASAVLRSLGHDVSKEGRALAVDSPVQYAVVVAADDQPLIDDDDDHVDGDGVELHHSPDDVVDDELVVAAAAVDDAVDAVLVNDALRSMCSVAVVAGDGVLCRYCGPFFARSFGTEIN